MRKIAASLLVLALTGAAAFADDATILPKGVFRARLIPSYSMTDKEFDADGEKVDTSAEGTITTISGAFELGVVESVTVGLKWAPGYYAMSDLTNPPLANMDEVVYTGPADLEIGAKVQVLGEQGFVKSDALRVALTPGFSIPLDSYDAEAEFESYQAGDPFRAATTSGHSSLGFGVKADADYMLNKMFFLNLHGQAFYYLPSSYTTFTTVATYYGALAAYGAATAQAVSPIEDTETAYGLEYAVEFEPHAKIAIDKKTSVNLGLPIFYSLNLADTMTYNGNETESDDATFLKVSPYVSCFTLIGPLPVEAQIQYDYPVMGTNSKSTSTLTLQLKFFGKLY